MPSCSDSLLAVKRMLTSTFFFHTLFYFYFYISANVQVMLRIMEFHITYRKWFFSLYSSLYSRRLMMCCGWALVAAELYSLPRSFLPFRVNQQTLNLVESPSPPWMRSPTTRMLGHGVAEFFFREADQEQRARSTREDFLQDNGTDEHSIKNEVSNSRPRLLHRLIICASSQPECKGASSFQILLSLEESHHLCGSPWAQGMQNGMARSATRPTEGFHMNRGICTCMPPRRANEVTSLSIFFMVTILMR